MEEKEAIYLDTNNMEWIEHISKNNGGKTLYRKHLLKTDNDTGMLIDIIKYKKGYYTNRHRHNCAHGIYVLEGTLRTDKGTYGKGEFVWFPEGCHMQHGATDDEDVTVLFVTNKVFDMIYE